MKAKTRPGTEKNAPEDRVPLLFVFLSGLGVTVQSLAVKILSEKGLHLSLPVILTKSICQAVISAFFITVEDKSKKNSLTGIMDLLGDRWQSRSVLLVRCVLGYIGLQSALMAVEFISVGDSTILVMMSPIISSLVAFLMLSEPWRVPELIATALATMGGILVTKPPILFGSEGEGNLNADSHDFMVGVSLSLLAACCTGVSYVLVRMLGTSLPMHWARICFVQAIVQIALCIPNMYIFEEPFPIDLAGEAYLLMLVTGLLGTVSLLLMTIGMQREKSASATAMLTSKVIFSYAMQVVFTLDPVSMTSLLGAGLVSAGILVIVFAKPA